MRKMFTLVIAFCILSLAGCQKTVTAPVPGSINTLDALSFRVTQDSAAAIEVIKTWQQCSINNFPPTIVVDGVTQPCDPTAGQFPVSLTPDLNLAINAYNILASAGQAYHAGASNDATGLTNAITALEQAISQLLGNASSTVNPKSSTAAMVKTQLAAAKKQGGK